MFSIIVATHDSERALVPTLAALVPGATAGVVREVIVADAGSRDQTEEVADIAGCRFLSSSEPLGARLKAATATARGTWLMFLAAGVVPGTTWIDETIAFVEETERHDQSRAAAFDTGGRSIRAAVRRALRIFPAAQQGLIIRKTFYDELRGHPAIPDAESALLRRIGRRRLTTLRTSALSTDI